MIRTLTLLISTAVNVVLCSMVVSQSHDIVHQAHLLKEARDYVQGTVDMLKKHAASDEQMAKELNDCREDVKCCTTSWCGRLMKVQP